MKKNCTLFLLCAFFAFSISASAQNTALNLNGSNYVTVGAPGTSLLPSDFSVFTIEFWAYIPSYDASGQHQFISQGTPPFDFYIGYDGTDPLHSIVVGDPSQWGNTGVTMPVAQWVHIAVVSYSDNSAILYLNGKQVSSTPFFILSSGNFQIGIQDDDATQNMTGGIDELRLWNITRTPAQIRSNMFGPIDPNSPNLQAYYTMNDDITGMTVKNNSTGPDTYAAGVDGTWTGANSWATSPIQSADNALSFDGSGSQVNIPGNSNYDLSSGGTIELWLHPTALTAAYSTLISNRGPGGTQYVFKVSDNAILLDNGTDTISFPYALPSSAWSHLAFVYDGVNTTNVYLNTVAAPTATLIGTLTEAYGGSSTQPLTLGVTKNPLAADGDPFAGALDEVRIWNTQQAPADITANISAPLTGTESGLTGLFNFNEGIPSGDNQFLTTAFDNTANLNDGAITGFSLTGSASNFTEHDPTTLPVNFTSFTATAQKEQALLQWQTAQEQNSRDFGIERSTDGINYSAIGSVEAAGNSNSPINYSFVDPAPATGNNYYRLKETDLDNKFMYSVIRVLNFSAAADQKLVWFQTGERSVEVDLQQGNNEFYSVTDIGGNTVQQGQLSSGKLSLSQVVGGMYFVRVITSTGKQLTTKVIVK